MANFTTSRICLASVRCLAERSPQDRQLRHTVCHTFITRQAPLQCIKNPQKWLFLDVISTNNFELVWFFNFWPRRTRFARSQPTIASRFENKNVIFYIFRSLHHFKILISDTKSIDFIFCLENVLRSNGINQSGIVKNATYLNSL